MRPASLIALASLASLAPACGDAAGPADGGHDGGEGGISDLDAAPPEVAAAVWVESLGGPTHDELGGLAVDGTGRVALSAVYADPSGGPDTLYASRTEADGHVLWGTNLVPAPAGHGGAVAVDAAGDLFVTGAFVTSVSLAGKNTTAVGASDVFVTRLDPDGAPVWAVFGSAKGAHGDEGRALSLGPGGALWVVGRFHAPPGEPFTLGDKTAVGAGLDDIFLARLDAETGTVASLVALGSPEDESPNGLATTPAGDVAVVGGFRGRVDFGARALVAEADVDGFVWLLDAAGVPRWVKQGSGDGSDVFSAVATTADALLVAGETTGKHFRYDGKDVGKGGVMVLALDGTGVVVSSVRSSSQTSVALAVAVRPDGKHVVLGGKYSGGDDIGGAALPQAPDYASGDAFVLSLDEYLAARWLQGTLSLAAGVARGVAFSPDGSFVVGGSFTTAGRLGGETLTASGGTGDVDLFLARFPAAP